MFRSIVRQYAVTKDELYSLGMGKMVRSVIWVLKSTVIQNWTM